MKRPTKEQLMSAYNKSLPDLLKPGLKLVFCGINPGLYTAYMGHHFARPGNRFWPALYSSGFTSRLLYPSEEAILLDLGCGITNVVHRATNAASELSLDEYRMGKKILVDKMTLYKPEWVAFLGIEAYRKAFDRPNAVLGRQAEKIADTNVWILPSPSGLNAHYKPDDYTRLFTELRLVIKNG